MEPGQRPPVHMADLVPRGRAGATAWARSAQGLAAASGRCV